MDREELLQKLRPGDIILTGINEGLSVVIRKFTRAPVSHAMLYLGDGVVLDPVFPSIEKRSLLDALSDKDLVEIHRHPGLTEEKVQSLVALAKLYDKVNFDLAGLAGQAVSCMNDRDKNLLNIENAAYCSETIAEIYSMLQMPVSYKLPECTAPGDIRASGRVDHVLTLKGWKIPRPAPSLDAGVPSDHGLPRHGVPVDAGVPIDAGAPDAVPPTPSIPLSIDDGDVDRAGGGYWGRLKDWIEDHRPISSSAQSYARDDQENLEHHPEPPWKRYANQNQPWKIYAENNQLQPPENDDPHLVGSISEAPCGSPVFQQRFELAKRLAEIRGTSSFEEFANLPPILSGSSIIESQKPSWISGIDFDEAPLNDGGFDGNPNTPF